MPLSHKQQQQVDESLALIEKCQSKSQQLKALEIMRYSSSDITLRESVALSNWTTKVDNKPLFFDVDAVHKLRKFLKGSIELEQVNQQIEARIFALRKKGIKSAKIPSITPERMVKFMPCLHAHLGAPIQEVLSSDNAYIRSIVDGVLKGGAGGSMKAASLNSFISQVVSKVGGNLVGTAISSFAIENAGAASGTKLEKAIKAATKGLTKGAMKTISKGYSLPTVATTAAFAAGVGAVASLSKDSLAADIAIEAVIEGVSKGSLVSALYGSIQRNCYNIGWQCLDGKVDLNAREVDNFYADYFFSKSMQNLAKEYAPVVCNTIMTCTLAYLKSAMGTDKELRATEQFSCAIESNYTQAITYPDIMNTKMGSDALASSHSSVVDYIAPIAPIIVAAGVGFAVNELRKAFTNKSPKQLEVGPTIRVDKSRASKEV